MFEGADKQCIPPLVLDWLKDMLKLEWFWLSN
jgi:hypothetical protein